MKIYLEEQLAQIEQNMIEHFEENGLNYDDNYLLEKDYFPNSPIDLELEPDFIKWFYYFQGQYHIIRDVLKFVNN